MTLTDLQTALQGLNPYQIVQISSQVAEYLKLNDELKQTRPSICPVCNSRDARFIKKGFQAKKQRYQCKDCGSKFAYDTKQITSHSHQPVEAWVTVIEDTLSLTPLDKTAEKIAVCHETAFNMRHKLLAFMEIVNNSAALLDELVHPRHKMHLNYAGDSIFVQSFMLFPYPIPTNFYIEPKNIKKNH